MPHDAVRTLARLGPVAAPRLVAMLLKHEQPGARQHAAHILGQMGPAADPAVPALGKALADESHDVRLTAADALSHIGPTTGRVGPALVAAFREELPINNDQRGLEGSPSARIAIVRALAAAGEPGRRALARERPGEVLREGSALDEFHREVRPPGVVPDLVDLHDVGMPQGATASTSCRNRASSCGPA
jgi:HEAT repeat protein